MHISVVLDRSGSMSRIADDMVGGFNAFLEEQRATEGAMRVTLTQFDSEDPFEIVIDGVPLQEVTDLARSAYQPRGGTPLFDAVGRMIGRIDGDIAHRRELGLPEEDQMVVIITDGHENASTEHGRSSVFSMITARQEAGWSFIFLGADQDAFAAGGALGVSTANRAGWERSPEGARRSWRDVSYSAAEYRSSPRAVRRTNADHTYRSAPESGDDR